MRSTRLFFVALAAVLSIGVADAAECALVSTTDVLKKIDATPSVAKCGVASGFSLNPPPGKPTVAQLDSLCAQETCRSAVGAIASMKVPSCTISMLNGINLREIVDSISAHCSKKAPTTAKKLSDDTAILAATAPGPGPASPSKTKTKTSPPTPTKATGGKTSYPTSAPEKTTTTGPSSAAAAAAATPAAAEGTRKPNLRKNCHD